MIVRPDGTPTSCCADDVRSRGNDMVELTCHCGEPCAFQSGECIRCGQFRENEEGDLLHRVYRLTPEEFAKIDEGEVK